MKLPFDIAPLKKLLWLDTFLGGTTGLVGLCFYTLLEELMGLDVKFIVTVSVVTFCYAIVALALAVQKKISLPLLRVLIFANWFWATISIGFVVFFFNSAYLLGKVFLMLQVLVVCGLAYAEGKQLDN